jgi:hypothetical protein
MTKKGKTRLHESYMPLSREQIGRKTLQEIQERTGLSLPEQASELVTRITGTQPSVELKAGLEELVRHAIANGILVGQNKGADEERLRKRTGKELYEMLSSHLQEKLKERAKRAYVAVDSVKGLTELLRVCSNVLTEEANEEVYELDGRLAELKMELKDIVNSQADED